jgi:ubiquinone/menaquinone biosynthesis C-methylase UbiE
VPAEPWAVALFRRSVLKQRKLAEISALLGPTEGRRCLDLGSDNGVVSLMLRRAGGRWASADLTEEAVRSIRELVASDVHLVSGQHLPFPEGEFDCVAVVDMLEHVEDDRAFLAELSRVLRPGGRLVVNTPHRRDTVLRRVRDRVGLTDEKHGHVRPGYTPEELRRLVEESGRFSWNDHHTYSRVFSEAVDLAVNLGVALLGKGHSKKGMVVTGQDVARHRNAFRAYSILFPFVRAFASLDRLVPGSAGYMLIASATRRDN